MQSLQHSFQGLFLHLSHFIFSFSKNYKLSLIKYTLSHSTNSNVNFCDGYNLSFETKKGLYRNQSYDSKHKELLEKMFGSDEDGAKTEERRYDSVGDFIYPKTKDNTKDIIKTKPITKPKI